MWAYQTINDWYDREIDAINEPYRPIPSGAISEPEVREILTYVFGSFFCLRLDFEILALLSSNTVLGFAGHSSDLGSSAWRIRGSIWFG